MSKKVIDSKNKIKNETSSLEEIIGLTKDYAELTKVNESLQHENFKLQVRLDACLYSMILMQDIIKGTCTKTSEIKANSLSLAT